MISLILPVYNGEQYLPRALASIQAQSLLPAEIIFIDDGSTDSTFEILQSFHLNTKIQIIRNKQNLGSVKATNLGFQRASSPFVFKIDHDDYLENHCVYLLSQASQITNQKYIYGDYYEIENDILKYNQITHPFQTAANTVLYRKSELEKVNYYSEKVYFAEYDLLLKLGLDHGFYLNKPLYTYFRHSASLTKSSWYQTALIQFEQLYGRDLAQKIRLY